MEHSTTLSFRCDYSLRVFLAVVTIVFGAWLLLPMESYVARGLQPFSSFISESAFGSLALVVGLTALFCAITRIQIELASVLGAAFWTFVSSLVMPTAPSGPGPVMFVCFAVANYVLLYRATKM